ncbi:unnamed protein product, partial [Ectocarpus fasciculatus]
GFQWWRRSRGRGLRPAAAAGAARAAEQRQGFGLFNAPVFSSHSQFNNGLDQSPAPLLTLLESKRRDGRASVRTALNRAIHWNIRQDNLASQSHLCQAWRQVLEVALIGSSPLLFAPREDPSKAVASRRLLLALL